VGDIEERRHDRRHLELGISPGSRFFLSMVVLVRAFGLTLFLLLVPILVSCSVDLALLAEHLATRHLTSVTVVFEGIGLDALSSRTREVESLRDALGWRALYAVQNMEMKVWADPPTFLIGVSSWHPLVGESPLVLEGRPIKRSKECLLGSSWANLSGLAVGDSVEILGENLVVVGFSSLESATGRTDGTQTIDRAVHVSSSLLGRLVGRIVGQTNLSYSLLATFVPRSPIRADDLRDELAEKMPDARIYSGPGVLHPSYLRLLHLALSQCVVFFTAVTGIALLGVGFLSDGGRCTVRRKIGLSLLGLLIASTTFLLVDLVLTRCYLLSLYLPVSVVSTSLTIGICGAVAHFRGGSVHNRPD
jgi:hypothetical protein